MHLSVRIESIFRGVETTGLGGTLVHDLAAVAGFTWWNMSVLRCWPIAHWFSPLFPVLSSQGHPLCSAGFVEPEPSLAVKLFDPSRWSSRYGWYFSCSLLIVLSPLLERIRPQRAGLSTQKFVACFAA
jgi:hypothetical protein